MMKLIVDVASDSANSYSEVELSESLSGEVSIRLSNPNREIVLRRKDLRNFLKLLEDE